MAQVTRFGLEGYGVRRAGSFAGKAASEPGGPHPVGILTRFGLEGYGVRRAGSFAGKASTVIIVIPIVVDGPHGPGWELFGRDYHPTWTRKRKYQEVEERLLQKLERAESAETKKERSAATKDLKAVIAEVLQQPGAEDIRLATLAEAIRQTELTNLTFSAYIDSVSAAVEKWRAAIERDDLEAAMIMMELL